LGDELPGLAFRRSSLFSVHGKIHGLGRTNHHKAAPGRWKAAVRLVKVR
jgi:hypothetical protein